MSAIIRACATLARCWTEEALRGRLGRTVIAPLADDAKAMAADAKEEHDQLRADLATAKERDAHVSKEVVRICAERESLGERLATVTADRDTARKQLAHTEDLLSSTAASALHWEQEHEAEQRAHASALEAERIERADCAKAQARVKELEGVLRDEGIVVEKGASDGG